MPGALAQFSFTYRSLQPIKVHSKAKHAHETAEQGGRAPSAIRCTLLDRIRSANRPEPLFQRLIRKRSQVLTDMIKVDVLRPAISFDHSQTSRISLEGQRPRAHGRDAEGQPDEKIAVLAEYFHYDWI